MLASCGSIAITSATGGDGGRHVMNATRMIAAGAMSALTLLAAAGPVHAAPGGGVQGTRQVEKLKAACPAMFANPVKSTYRPVMRAWWDAPGTVTTRQVSRTEYEDPAFPETTSTRQEDSVVDANGVTRTVYSSEGVPSYVRIEVHYRPGWINHYERTATAGNAGVKDDRAPAKWIRSYGYQRDGDPFHGNATDPLVTRENQHLTLDPLKSLPHGPNPEYATMTLGDGTITWEYPSPLYLETHPKPDLTSWAAPTNEYGTLWSDSTWTLSNDCTTVDTASTRVLYFDSPDKGRARQTITITAHFQAQPVRDIAVPEGPSVIKDPSGSRPSER